MCIVMLGSGSGVMEFFLWTFVFLKYFLFYRHVPLCYFKTANKLIWEDRLLSI